jgi:hypothetical protein
VFGYVLAYDKKRGLYMMLRQQIEKFRG